MIARRDGPWDKAGVRPRPGKGRGRHRISRLVAEREAFPETAQKGERPLARARPEQGLPPSNPVLVNFDGGQITRGQSQ